MKSSGERDDVEGAVPCRTVPAAGMTFTVPGTFGTSLQRQRRLEGPTAMSLPVPGTGPDALRGRSRALGATSPVSLPRPRARPCDVAEVPGTWNVRLGIRDGS